MAAPPLEQQLHARLRELEDLRSGRTERALVEKIAELQERLERRRIRDQEARSREMGEQREAEMAAGMRMVEQFRQELTMLLGRAQLMDDREAYHEYKNWHNFLTSQIGDEEMIRLGMTRVVLADLEPEAS